MFYKVQVKDPVRVPPNLFSLEHNEAVIQCIKKKFDGYISKDFGIVIDVLDVEEVRQGVIIPGDGAVYYDTTFNLLVYKPDMQEIVIGKIKDIADFGAFISMGPIEGMIHISQTMDDFVSLTKDKVLSGKDSKRSLKVGDICRARLIAISFKDISNPKFGLTMRQPFLGKPEWNVPPEEGEKKSKKKE